MKKQEKTKICIDTNILIWGVKERCTPGQEDMIERARLFLDSLDDYDVYVNSITIAELLCGIEDEAKANELKTILLKRFKIINFNTNSATIFAKLYSKKNNHIEILNEIDKNYHKSRQAIKVDYQIIATAISNNCEHLYSHDKGLSTFADGKIEVKEIPELEDWKGTQSKIF